MKRISRFDHFILMTSALLIVSGCGANKSIESTSFSTSAIMVATRDLTTAERTIATRICYAYQSKNTSFKTQTYYGGTFNFNMNYKDCSNVKSAYSVAGILSTSTTDTRALVYSTDTTMQFNKAVQTAQAGYLSQLCTKIQNNLVISNTVVDGSTRVQLSFTATDMDSYTLQYFSPVNNEMKIQSAETFKVRTQFNIVANQILGMDETYVRQQICTGDANAFTELNQVYVNYTPK
ncbi:MAG: hypothetical protein H7177_13215 [Rhizobacter sp.]|nr:hypothetical protein [Bacteriovorax sp.]